jgi:hypothetical protein
MTDTRTSEYVDADLYCALCDGSRIKISGRGAEAEGPLMEWIHVHAHRSASEDR